MSQNTQEDTKEIFSVVQPGSVLQGSLPKPLSGKLTKSKKPATQGAYSDIYKGSLDLNGVEVAVCIKVLRRCNVETPCDNVTSVEDRFERRIKRETKIWAAATHPNVLTFFGYQIEEGSPMLISPWACGGNLSAYLKPNAVPKEKKLKMLQDANEGLAYLHRLQPPIAHGDLKPENILVLDDDLTTALCDFGTSRVVVDLGIHTGMTTSGTAVGTAAYQARELISGDSLPTPASDVYAMAGVILAMLSGKVPFYNKPVQSAVLLAISLGTTPNPQHHPELSAYDPLWSLLGQCWLPDPSQRPIVDRIINELQLAIQRTREPPPPYAGVVSEGHST
ncbi:hypothetical protein FS837_000234 [Tulasnella sp. UAMH 9824]|nr:hypothetical protein FS837_000234 [Tulasnella sp. UAMH 9824]